MQNRFDCKAVNYIIPNPGTVGKRIADFYATSEMWRLFAACQIEATIISHPRFARLPDCWGSEVVSSIIGFCQGSRHCPWLRAWVGYRAASNGGVDEDAVLGGSKLRTN